MKAKTLLGVILFATVSLCTRAQNVVPQFVSFSPESDGVSLVNATIGYSQQEYEGVKMAIRSLQADMQRVMNYSPLLKEGQDTTRILVGTIDRNPAIAKLKLQDLKGKREKSDEKIPEEIEDLDFEFVLFASAMIDYDYIMELISKCMGKPAKWKMTKDELINLIRSSANLLEDRDDIIAYIDSLDGVNGRTEQQIKDGYEVFKAEKYANELSAVAQKYNLDTGAVMMFVNDIVERRIFDGEKLNELLEPLDLGWRDRTRKETELMNDLVPLLKRLVPGQEISGLKAYEE